MRPLFDSDKIYHLIEEVVAKMFMPEKDEDNDVKPYVSRKMREEKVEGNKMYPKVSMTFF